MCVVSRAMSTTFLVHSNLNNLRQEYIPKNYFKYRVMSQFVALMLKLFVTSLLLYIEVSNVSPFHISHYRCVSSQMVVL